MLFQPTWRNWTYNLLNGSLIVGLDISTHAHSTDERQETVTGRQHRGRDVIVVCTITLRAVRCTKASVNSVLVRCLLVCAVRCANHTGSADR